MRNRAEAKWQDTKMSRERIAEILAKDGPLTMAEVEELGDPLAPCGYTLEVITDERGLKTFQKPPIAGDPACDKMSHLAANPQKPKEPFKPWLNNSKDKHP